MKKIVNVMVLAILVVSYGTGYCASNARKAKGSAATSTTAYTDQGEYAHECQTSQHSHYSLGSAGSPSWMTLEEAVCRSQKQYPEYQESLVAVPGKEPGDEEMRRLLVIKDVWDNTPLQHQGGVMTVDPKNFMPHVPAEVSGLKLGTKIDLSGFMSSYILGAEDKPVTKRTQVDYLGNQMVTYFMHRRSDYFKAYHFHTLNTDGSKNTVKVVPSDDTKLQDEIAAWKETDKGFFAKLTSNKVPPTEFYTSKPVDLLGIKLDYPSYFFNANDQFIRMWGHLTYQEKPSLQQIAPSTADAFATLSNQLGEPALKAKNDKVKLAIWVAKDGTRVDFLCWENSGYCTASSSLVVQKSAAITDSKASSAADFFK